MAAGQLLHPGLSHLDFGVGEVQVGHLVHGDEVDVGVGHFQPNHGHADALAGHGRRHALGHALGKQVQGRQLGWGQVEDVVGFLLRNHQRVAFHQRGDVEKRQVLIVLGNFVGGQLARNDAGKDGWHDGLERLADSL